ncbi:hypothetical protein E2C01_016147 [Portunus trituberculatus]|uniref:Uncharacterized protein n=1 Tax=Portunus trituberculatus TaxID=210409 RepID=A0A5B7DPU7_PORTR|nr:hypothetical protein [Portunus trituberculatus]
MVVLLWGCSWSYKQCIRMQARKIMEKMRLSIEEVNNQYFTTQHDLRPAPHTSSHPLTSIPAPVVYHFSFPAQLRYSGGPLS